MPIKHDHPPDADQLEITLIGPGYGECAVVHLGNDHWIIVDSCLDSRTGEAAALGYLKSIGVDPAKSVDLILTTHWHDDHIAGMSSLLSHCPSAKFCCSSALTTTEFQSLVARYEKGSMISGGSGVREINKVSEIILEERGGHFVWATANRLIFRLEKTDSAHGQECRISTLSPSDAQYEKFLRGIAQLIPQINTTTRRCPTQLPNALSVVAWIEIGNLAVLLGGDLEETADDVTGWSVIVASAERPPGRATIFKVPHHGSENAHSEGIWSDMLTVQPLAVLAPWNRGRTKRPSTNDVERILQYTEKAYSTASLKLTGVRKRSRPVEKTIKEQGIKLRRVEPQTGIVRLRSTQLDDKETWTVELLNGACHLSEVHAAA